MENREREKNGEGKKEEDEEGNERNGEVELVSTPDLKSLSDAIFRIQQKKTTKALKLDFNFSF